MRRYTLNFMSDLSVPSRASTLFFDVFTSVNAQIHSLTGRGSDLRRGSRLQNQILGKMCSREERMKGLDLLAECEVRWIEG